MSRYLRLLALSLFNICFFFSQSVFAATITVDADNAITQSSPFTRADCDGNKSQPSATTLSAALASAQERDTILICPGTYAEEVLVATSHLLISGLRGQGNTIDAILDGEGTRHVGISIAGDVETVTIQGISVENYLDAAIEAVQGPTYHVLIQDATFRNNANGVVAGDETNPVGTFTHTYFRVRRSVFTSDSNTGTAIAFTNCRNCRIQRNDIDAGNIGIILRAQNSSDPSLINNRLLLNTVTHVASVGILLESVQNTTLKSPTLQRNTVADTQSGVGIRLFAHDNAAIRGGKVVQSTLLPEVPGIEVLTETGGVIEKVKFADN
ncbi:MAG: right-handed parallel beta-helix repeat-containing protein [Deltaproteobacteria bacterium]|nr:right-handed parallel beta-helix repeat-containing protein [Deltaproteobacteria bacterium]